MGFHSDNFLIYKKLSFFDFFYVLLFLIFFQNIFKSYYYLKSKSSYLEYTIVRYILVIVIFFTASYVIHFTNQWNKINSVLKVFIKQEEHEKKMESQIGIQSKLPNWLSLTLKFDKNRILYSFLKSGSLLDESYFELFEKLSGSMMVKSELSDITREQIMKFYFGEKENIINKNSEINRIETNIKINESFHSASVQVKVNLLSLKSENKKHFSFQLDPKACLIQVKNLNKPEDYTFSVTKKNSTDYTISMSGKNLIDEEEILLIEYENYLSRKDNKLQFKGFEILNSSMMIPHRIIIEANKNIKNINLQFVSNDYHIEKDFRKLDRKLSFYYAYGNFLNAWTLEIISEAKTAIEDSANIGIGNVVTKNKIDEIIMLLDPSLKKSQWIELYKSLQRIPYISRIHLVSNDWFTPRQLFEGIEYLEKIELSKFHLLPFNNLSDRKTYLVIANSNGNFFNLQDLNPSDYFDRLILYFKINKNRLFFHSPAQKNPRYIQDLIDYNLIIESKPLTEINRYSLLPTNSIQPDSKIDLTNELLSAKEKSYSEITDFPEILRDRKMNSKMRKLIGDGFYSEFK